MERALLANNEAPHYEHGEGWKGWKRVLGPNGEVVGTMVVAGDTVPHAFIWQAGHLTDLGQGSPIAINSRGEIIGTRGWIPILWRKKRG